MANGYVEGCLYTFEIKYEWSCDALGLWCEIAEHSQRENNGQEENNERLNNDWNTL